MGKPCGLLYVRLCSVESQEFKHQPLKQGDVDYCTGTVLHIINRAEHSFINEELARYLLPITFGSNAPTIDFGHDTVVELEWCYPGANTSQVTKHLVLRESPFHVTLRKEDWEQPMDNFLRQKFPQRLLRQRRAPPPELSLKIDSREKYTAVLEDHDSDRDTDNESANGSIAQSAPNSPFGFSQTSTATTYCEEGECMGMGAGWHGQSHLHSPKFECEDNGGEGPKKDKARKPEPTTKKENEIYHISETGVEGGNGDFGEFEDENDNSEGTNWLKFEVINTDEEADANDKQEDAYWTWSRENSCWVHDQQHWSPECM